ncbi:hypothetical protein KRM28CT15_17540 [Krasilnikovia sp. M28-CT-15]
MLRLSSGAVPASIWATYPWLYPGQVRKHALAEITLEPPTADPHSDVVQRGAGFPPVRNHGTTIRQHLSLDYQANGRAMEWLCQSQVNLCSTWWRAAVAPRPTYPAS